MKKCVMSLVYVTFFLVTPLYGGSLGTMPQTKDYGEAIALSYLQRVYFSLDQALFYAEKSRSTKDLASFDYDRLLNDLGLIKKDVEAYLYPRNEKITGGAIPFRIEGDYFLQDIINSR